MPIHTKILFKIIYNKNVLLLYILCPVLSGALSPYYTNIYYMAKRIRSRPIFFFHIAYIYII